jgi:hypothetical protein
MSPQIVTEVLFYGGAVLALLQVVSLVFHHLQNQKLNAIGDALDTVVSDAKVIGVQPPKLG